MSRWGGVVFHDVTNANHARRRREAGVDGLIAVADGAGGHAGTLNPFALVAEIRAFFDKTLILAGCINTGAQVLAAQAMGADLAYMGTRFIATQESARAGGLQADDPRRARRRHRLHARGQRRARELHATVPGEGGLRHGSAQPPGDVNYGEKLKPLDEEAKAWKTVWSAGQGVGTIDDVPTAAELCARLKAELSAAKSQL